jgi:hypothetical protein
MWHIPYASKIVIKIRLYFKHWLGEIYNFLVSSTVSSSSDVHECFELGHVKFERE